MVNDPSGAVLSMCSSQEEKPMLDKIDSSAHGMIARWMLVTLNSLERIDQYSSKLKYVSTERTHHKGLVFRWDSNQRIVVGLFLGEKADIAKIYTKVCDFLQTVS